MTYLRALGADGGCMFGLLVADRWSPGKTPTVCKHYYHS